MSGELTLKLTRKGTEEPNQEVKKGGKKQSGGRSVQWLNSSVWITDQGAGVFQRRGNRDITAAAYI